MKTTHFELSELEQTTKLSELEQTSSKCISDSEKRLRKKLYVCIIPILTLTESKHFVIHDKVALLTRRCSDWGTRNRHQRIFRKVLTIRKR